MRKSSDRWKLHVTMLIASIGLVSCSGGGGEEAGAAGRVFFDGFENGNTDLWSQDGFRNRCQVVASAADGGPGSMGNYMARCNWNGAVAWNDPAAFETLTINTSDYTDELFIRAWVRVDNNVGRTDGSPLKLLRWFYNQNGVYHDLIENVTSASGLSNRGNTTFVTFPTYWGGAPGDNSAVSSAWHKVEYYIGQSAGTVKVWHDGLLIRDDTGYDFEGVKWSPFYLASNWSDGHDATNYLYFDQIEVFSDRGTGATGSMSGASISN